MTEIFIEAGITVVEFPYNTLHLDASNVVIVYDSPSPAVPPFIEEYVVLKAPFVAGDPFPCANSCKFPKIFGSPGATYRPSSFARHEARKHL